NELHGAPGLASDVIARGRISRRSFAAEVAANTDVMEEKVLRGEVEDQRHLVFGAEQRLVGVPELDPATRADLDDRGLWLQVALVHGTGPERVLQDEIRLGETGLRI